jgi:hypothetical protein
MPVIGDPAKANKRGHAVTRPFDPWIALAIFLGKYGRAGKSYGRMSGGK